MNWSVVRNYCTHPKYGTFSINYIRIKNRIYIHVMTLSIMLMMMMMRASERRNSQEGKTLGEQNQIQPRHLVQMSHSQITTHEAVGAAEPTLSVKSNTEPKSQLKPNSLNQISLFDDEDYDRLATPANVPKNQISF